MDEAIHRIIAIIAVWEDLIKLFGVDKLLGEKKFRKIKYLILASLLKFLIEQFPITKFNNNANEWEADIFNECVIWAYHLRNRFLHGQRSEYEDLKMKIISTKSKLNLHFEDIHKNTVFIFTLILLRFIYYKKKELQLKIQQQTTSIIKNATQLQKDPYFDSLIKLHVKRTTK